MAEKSNIEFPRSNSPMGTDDTSKGSKIVGGLVVGGMLASALSGCAKEQNTKANNPNVYPEETPITESISEVPFTQEKIEERKLIHQGFWTVDTNMDDRPNIADKDIIAGILTDEKTGIATLYLMTDKTRTHDELDGKLLGLKLDGELVGPEYNAYLGDLTEENIEQIVMEIEGRKRIEIKDFKIKDIVTPDGLVEEFAEPYEYQETSDVTFIDDWTREYQPEDKPNIKDLDIISIHTDPNNSDEKRGEASILFVIMDDKSVTMEELEKLVGNVDNEYKYFNGFEGILTKEARDKIIDDLHTNIRPNVRGFNIKNIEIVYLSDLIKE